MALTRRGPTRENWSYGDLFALPDEGKRYEIIEGVLYEMPGPGSDHATVIRTLIALLLPAFVALRLEWFTAPLDVFFPGADPVEPDLLAYASGGKTRRSKRGIEGPPDLVIEVLSPSSRRHDLLTKRTLYARAGVREYWLVDPEARTVSILTLVGDVFREHQIASGSTSISSPLLSVASIPAEAVFVDLNDLDRAP